MARLNVSRTPSWRAKRRGSTTAGGRWRRLARLFLTGADRVPGAARACRAVGAWYAGHQDVPSILVEHGRHSQFRVDESIAYFRHLGSKPRPTTSKVDLLYAKFGEAGPTADAMRALLSLDGFDMPQSAIERNPHAFTDRIRSELTRTGSSRLLQWLAERGAYDADDPVFRDLIGFRAKAALDRRAQFEAARLRSDPIDSTRGLIERLSRVGDDEVFVVGSTLREVAGGPATATTALAECGTFKPLPSVAAAVGEHGLAVTSIGRDRLVVSDGTNVAQIDRFAMHGDEAIHYDGPLQRRHRRFDPVRRAINGIDWVIPSDPMTYLAERFGSWRTEMVMWDDAIDPPTTHVADSIEGLLYTYRRCEQAFAQAVPFVARNMSMVLRDQFGVDFTDYLPQPVHPKVLFTPLAAQCPERCHPTMVVGSFEVIDVETVILLENSRPAGGHLVAAVTASPEDDHRDRLATVKTLRSVDHVVAWDSPSRLTGQISAMGVTSVVLTAGTDLTPELLAAACDETGVQVAIDWAPVR